MNFLLNEASNDLLNNYLQNPDQIPNSPEEFPSELHRACSLGSELYVRNVLSLLNPKGIMLITHMKNARGQTPADIARANGYPNITELLNKFSQAADVFHSVEAFAPDPSLMVINGLISNITFPDSENNLITSIENGFLLENDNRSDVSDTPDSEEDN